MNFVTGANLSGKMTYQGLLLHKNGILRNKLTRERYCRDQKIANPMIYIVNRIRKATSVTSKRCEKDMIQKGLRNKQPSVYDIREKVLISYPAAKKVSSRRKNHQQKFENL